MKCEYCNHLFLTKQILNNHQKNAKYCLKLRGDKKASFICDICDKDYTEKRIFEKHIEKCGLIFKNKELVLQVAKLSQALALSEQYAQEQIEGYKKIISDLHQHIKSIAVAGVNKSTTTNILKLPRLTGAHLEDKSQYLTQEHVNRGLAGYVDMAFTHSLNGMAICSDPSRKKFKFVDEDGKIVYDAKGMTLAKLFFDSIQSKSEPFIRYARETIMEQMQDMNAKDINYLNVKMMELVNIEAGMNDISSSKGIELRRDFANKLCTMMANKGTVVVDEDE